MPKSTKLDFDLLKSLGKELFLQCFPDEVIIFPILWDEFIQSDLLDYSPHDIHQDFRKKISGALAFADTLKVEPRGAFGLLILGMTMIEVSQIKTPSSQKIREAAYACAKILDAPPDVADRIVACITEMLDREKLDRTGSKECRVNADFLDVGTNGDLRDRHGLFRIQSRQGAVLFRELVRKGRVHWLDGFRLFPSWQRQAPAEPYVRFRSIISSIRASVDNRSMGIAIKSLKAEGSENTGYWEIAVPISVELTGSIIESKKLLATALETYRNGRLEESARASLAGFITDQQNVEHVCMLAQQLTSLDWTGVEDTIKRAWMTARKHEQSLRLTEVALVRLMERNTSASDTFHDNRWVHHQTEFLDQIRKQASKINRARISIEVFLENRKLLTDDDIVLRELSQYIQALDKTGEREWGLRMLLAHSHVHEVFRVAEAKCRKTFFITANERKDLQATIQSVFCDGTQISSRDLADFESFEHLKRAWAYRLARAAFEVFATERWGIDKQDAKLLLKFLSVWANPGGASERITDDMLREKLKWSKEQFIRAINLFNVLREKKRFKSTTDIRESTADGNWFAVDYIDNE